MTSENAQGKIPGEPLREEAPARPRLSRLAILAFLSAAAQLPVLFLLGRSGLIDILPALAFLLPVAAVVLGVVARSRIRGSEGRLAGRGIAGVGRWAGIGLLCLTAIWLPALLGPTEKSRYSVAMSDTTVAARQAIQYGKDKGVYPMSLSALRESGYANVQDKNPWGREYVLSPSLTAGATPRPADDIYVYSKGPCGTGTYERSRRRQEGEGRWDTGKWGAAGYSSIYGSFVGQ